MNPSPHPDAVVAALSVRGLLDLADAVCVHRGVTRDEICGSQRTKAATAARHELWWLIRHHPERAYSYAEIARIVRRDHTSVRYGIAAHQRRYVAVAG